MMRTYFSPIEANRLLIEIKPQLEALARIQEELALLDNTKLEFSEHSMETMLLEIELNRNFHEKNIECFAILADLIRKGCIVRDLETLEIDFYSKLENKDIFLCWMKGDSDIRYWHELTEGCEKRKPVSSIQKNYANRIRKLV